MPPHLRPHTSILLRCDHCHRQVSFLQKVGAMAKDVCEDCAGDQDALRHLYFESEQDGDANFEIDNESTTSEESQDEDLDEESNDESNEEVWELPSVSEEALPLKKNSPVHRDIDQDQSRDDFRATSSTQSRVRQSQVRGPKDNSRLGETFNARGGSAGDVISTKSVDNPDAVAWPPFGPFENDYPPEERPKLTTSQLASRYVKRRKWTRRNAPVEQISGTKRELPEETATSRSPSPEHDERPHKARRV